MADLNRVILIGRLTRDIELRYTPAGAAVVNLNLAINYDFTTREGEKKKEVCYVTVVVWGKQAENCEQYLAKGSQVCVDGRLQYRSWEGQSGEKRSALEVVARNVQFLDRAKPDEQDERVEPSIERDEKEVTDGYSPEEEKE
ncbi:single-stranded DNA-binding protein [candidate division NPL-UPA2 bacterium Unc8]|uniref:Single-stranded DNA-binding protein n=1 Tax=candidate division NPL-UPA2 bacterium Unc8 TaxID=1980939 RepID=A0A399FUR6_UNCN2|nr:Single-stranded DNA-binding protein A [Bacillota bacterium]MBT9147566.1 Single-stranded DNA-binding protein A [Bacillota bacterium]RII00105.1 MAG: single-stranded DNA-binding protein [candidate division NPL-UPA2 bacterium Unc8]